MNPYSPPAAQPAAGYPPVSAPASTSVSERAVELLRQTRPWVRLLSIFAFIGSGFMLLFGLGMTAWAVIGRGASAGEMAIGLVYIPVALFYVYPGVKLWTYGSAIGRLLTSRASGDLETALGEQKSFWKFCGIAALAVLALYAIVIAAGAVIGAFSAIRGMR